MFTNGIQCSRWEGEEKKAGKKVKATWKRKRREKEVRIINAEEMSSEHIQRQRKACRYRRWKFQRERERKEKPGAVYKFLMEVRKRKGKRTREKAIERHHSFAQRIETNDEILRLCFSFPSLVRHQLLIFGFHFHYQCLVFAPIVHMYRRSRSRACLCVSPQPNGIVWRTDKICVRRRLNHSNWTGNSYWSLWFRVLNMLHHEDTSVSRGDR